jgi:hypothetical protein
MDAKIAHGIVSKRVCLEAPVHSDTEGNNQPVGANRAHNAQVTTAVNLKFCAAPCFCRREQPGRKACVQSTFPGGSGPVQCEAQKR